MVKSLAISTLTLPELEAGKNLKLTDNSTFFTEWREPLPELEDEEKRYLDQVQAEYFDQARNGRLAEGLIKLIVMSPLLHLAGFYRQPFEVKLEESVEVETIETDEVWKGRIDALVINNYFWILVVEAKQSAFGIDIAIPQALGYMLANPYPERVVYGLVTNGSSFAFLKLVHTPEPVYDISDVMLLLPGRNVLHQVLRVMKQLGQQALN
jgi:hypothetical protein